MSSGTLRRLSPGSGGVMDAARCPVCAHPARIHNAVGCVSGPCECVVTRAELMPDAPRLEIPDGIESTPAASAAATADGGGGHAAEGRPGAAHASAAPAVAAVRPSSGWDPPKVRPLPPLPGAGVPRTPPMPGEVATPDESVARRVDEIVAAGKLAAKKRPRQSSARPAVSRALGAAVVGEPDAAGEVAADVLGGPRAATEPPEPEPLDLGPFLNASLTYYAAWACPRHPVQRRHDPGACPLVECSRALVPVYVVVAPRELP